MSMSPLKATFEAAKAFGLTDDEAWRIAEASLLEAFGEDAPTDYHDKLVAAFAARILTKQRAAGPSRTAGTGTARRTG